MEDTKRWKKRWKTQTFWTQTAQNSKGHGNSIVSLPGLRRSRPEGLCLILWFFLTIREVLLVDGSYSILMCRCQNVLRQP